MSKVDAEFLNAAERVVSAGECVWSRMIHGLSVERAMLCLGVNVESCELECVGRLIS